MMMDVIEENNYTSNELSAVETGRIIVAARELEQLLREAGAPESAVGLHQATEAMAHKLPEELQKKLHYIATVRNQAAHGNGILREAINLNEFEAGAYEVKQALQQLSGKGGRKRNKKNFQISPGTENMSDPIAGDLQKFYRILGIFGCLPVANLVYFAVLIFQGLYAARQAFLLLIFYAMALVLLLDGILEQEALYWGSGTLLMTGVYLCGILSGEQFRKKCEISRWWYWMPLLDCGYFVLLLLVSLDWKRFLSGVIPLGLTVGGCFLFSFQKTDAALVMAGAGYLVGVATVFARWNEFFFKVPEERDGQDHVA